MAYESDTNYKWSDRNRLKKLIKEIVRVRNRKRCRGHLNYSMTKIDQNTEESPGDLRRLPVTQIPMKDYLQTLM